MPIHQHFSLEERAPKNCGLMFMCYVFNCIRIDCTYDVSSVLFDKLLGRIVVALYAKCGDSIG